MPSRLNTPVLTLDAGKIHQIDPRNVESLFGMWTVFNKCSQSIKDGSRLENLSWRLWARETLCCPPQPETAIVPAFDIPLAQPTDVPPLSSSVASHESGDEELLQPVCKQRSISSLGLDSAMSISRGQEKHLTPQTLEKIVTIIQEKTELGPLSPSLEASIPAIPPPETSPLEPSTAGRVENGAMQDSTTSCTSNSTQNTLVTVDSHRSSEHRNSDTSISSDGLIRSGSVVHGFTPPPPSFRNKPSIVLAPSSSSRLIPTPQQKQSNVFTLGCSSEDESSFEQRVMTLRPAHKRSSLSQSLTEQDIAQPDDKKEKKKTSFKDVIEAHKIQEDTDVDEGAIESDEEEDDEVADSAIEDEDEAEWEDSMSEDGRPSAPSQPLFKRVDSRHNMASRRSLLTTALTEPERARALLGAAIRSSPALQRSRNTSPEGPSLPSSPGDHEDDESGMVMTGTSSRPMPMPAPASSSRAMAQSPRSTRRNMLSTELTESLRKNLLWERQQKSQTANAFLRRSRNAQSMANLQAHSQPAARSGRPSQETSRHNSFDQYFENQWEYHNIGW